MTRGADTERRLDTFEEYAEAHETAGFTNWLRERAQPEWSNATTHRFTRELGTENLDDKVFRRYLVQDYAFVETLVGIFGHAVGDAPTMESKSRFVDFLGTLTADENDYFERSFEALDIPEAEHADPELTPTMRTFEDLLERAAREGGYGETLAVLLPAEWIYLEWATAVEDKSPSRFYFAEWIDLHANEEFETFVTWLRDELDREGEAASPRRQRRIERLFRRTVSLEVAFFDAAYDPESAMEVAGGRSDG
ncbi:TenA family protein [Haladaptatus halobius]|uniref:TenA family protein n=1 Tax=Haladaptatus halobius TaxID=2884875 RepID=UPI001D0AFD3F|nr:TenA family protein [Haladaptatus halobius]